MFFALLSLVLAVLLYRAKTSAPERSTASRTPVPAPHSTTRPRPDKPRPDKASPDKARPDRARPENGREPRALPTPPAAATAIVAIVIDDLGNDRAAVERIGRWPWAVSGAVLPSLAGSEEAARELGRSGKDVLLHLPMEPLGFPKVRPGPGVVLLSQSDGEIASTVETDLASVPGAVGVNNHMGSAATADPRVMRAIAKVLARRGLFFVDSRTTDATVAIDAARAAGVRAASRRVFLDDVQTESAIEASLDSLVEKAKAEGSAIGIGHPYPATLAVLDRELPKLERRGVKLVRVSELVE